MRDHLHRVPFVPFVVEKYDGSAVVIPRPRLLFSAGSAAFISPAQELVEFTHTEVRAVRLAEQGSTT